MADLNTPVIDGEEEEKPDPVTFKADLYQAAKLNDSEKVLNFISIGVPTNYVDFESTMTALHWAAIYGNSIVIKALLDSGASKAYHRQRAKILKAAIKNKASSQNTANVELTAVPPADHEVINESVDEAPQVSNENINTSNLSVEPVVGGDSRPVTADPNTVVTPVTDSNPVTTPAVLLNDIGNSTLTEAKYADDDYPDDPLEDNYDFTVNTPLLWAAGKGFLHPLWLLLQDGFSPNDLDSLGNNALHLAAANGNLKVVKSLIEDGANPNLVNIYKNKPIDMAISKEVRDIISVAMVKNASMTIEDSANMHKSNLRSYQNLIRNLSTSIEEASAMDNPRVDIANLDLVAMMNNLSETIRVSKEWALDADLIEDAEYLLARMEATQDLRSDISSVQILMPIKNQTDYSNGVEKLQKALVKAESFEVDKSMLLYAEELISRCQIEYFIQILVNRVKNITCAVDANEHDMIRLRKAIQKGQALRADDSILDPALALYSRLNCELGMSRALAAMPAYRLPMENPPEGYYQPSDFGKVVETPEYPLPPAETNEYLWEQSLSLTSLKTAIDRLRQSYNGADAFGANAAVIAESKDKLTKAEKDLKLLDAKDVTDKAAAIEVVTKAAKKLKKGKKK